MRGVRSGQAIQDRTFQEGLSNLAMSHSPSFLGEGGTGSAWSKPSLHSAILHTLTIRSGSVHAASKKRPLTRRTAARRCALGASMPRRCHWGEESCEVCKGGLKLSALSVLVDSCTCFCYHQIHTPASISTLATPMTSVATAEAGGQHQGSGQARIRP